MLGNDKVSARARRLGSLTDAEWLRHRQIEVERSIRSAHRERAKAMNRYLLGFFGLVRR